MGLTSWRGRVWQWESQIRVYTLSENHLCRGSDFWNPSLGHKEQVFSIPSRLFSSSHYQKVLKACPGIAVFLIFTMRLTILKKRTGKTHAKMILPPLPSNCWRTKLHLEWSLSKICDRGLLTDPSVPFRSAACKGWEQMGSLRQQSGCRIIRLNLRALLTFALSKTASSLQE